MRQKMPKDLDTFGNRLQALRAVADISYANLAEAIVAMVNKPKFNLSGNAIHKWTRKGGNIKVQNVEYLAQHFNVNAAWLLWGEVDTSPPAYLEAIYRAPNNIRQIRGARQAVKKKR